MEIFNIFSISEPFKTGASGSGLGVPYTIQYNMSVMGTELDGTRYIRNYGKGGNSFNAEAFASNHIYLNGTTQSVPYAITGGTLVTYYDVATKSFISDTASNPYTIITSNSVLFSHTSALADADKSELNADPNLAFRMFFDGEVLPSGFSRANDMVNCNFYGGNEGLASAEKVYDLSDQTFLTYVSIVDYDALTRTTLVNQPNGASNLKLIRDSSGRTTGTALANTTQWEADGRTAVTNWTITAPFTVTEYIGETGQTLGDNEITGSSWSLVVLDEIATLTNNTASTFTLAVTTVGTSAYRPYIRINSTANSSTKSYKISFTAIVNSGTPVIKRLYNGANYDPEYTVVNGYNEIVLVNSGDDAYGSLIVYFVGTQLFDVSATNFLVEEIIPAVAPDIYTFTSDGNRYKNTVADGTYTLPTGIWTFDEFGFDGVTPVTSRGVTRMIDEVVIP